MYPVFTKAIPFILYPKAVKESIFAEKAAKRGGFEKRILLKEVYED